MTDPTYTGVILAFGIAAFLIFRRIWRSLRDPEFPFDDPQFPPD